MTPRFFRFAMSPGRPLLVPDVPAGWEWCWYECDASGDALDIDQFEGPYPSYLAAFNAAGEEVAALAESVSAP